MGLRKTVAKSAFYAFSPKTAFAALNPGKAIAATAAGWAFDRIMPERKPSRGAMAAKGIGAAALTIPLGIWLGQRFLPENDTRAPATS